MPQINIIDAEIETEEDGLMPVKVIKAGGMDGVLTEIIVSLEDAVKMAEYLAAPPEAKPDVKLEVPAAKKLEVPGGN